MNTRKDICVPRQKKDGGTYWVKIGTAWEGQKGIQLVFDALPIPDAEGRCVANLFEPRDNSQARGTGGIVNKTAGQSFASADLDDEAPF